MTAHWEAAAGISVASGAGLRGEWVGSLARTDGTGPAPESQPLGSTIVQWTAASWAESVTGGETSDGQGGLERKRGRKSSKIREKIYR